MDCKTGKKILFYLLFLISLCALTVGSASAKFTVSDETRDYARMARFSVLTEMRSPSHLDFSIGEVKSVDFTVSNGDGNASEVTIEYDVLVTVPATMRSPNFIMRLLCNGEQRGGETFEPQNDTLVYTFPRVGTFDAGEKETHECSLSLEISDPETSGAFQLTIDVFARQIR